MIDFKVERFNKDTEKKVLAIYKSKIYNWTKKDMEKQIQQNKKHTMSKRTIERCIKEDPRIVKDGQYYYINDEARFERRYQRPEMFGEDMRYALFKGSTDSTWRSARGAPVTLISRPSAATLAPTPAPNSGIPR